MSTDDPLTRSIVDDLQRARNGRLRREIARRRVYYDLPFWERLRTPRPAGCRLISFRARWS